MKLLLLFLSPLLLVAKVHYAKLEPYDVVTVKSAVSAQVVDVALTLEGSNINHQRVIHLDDRLDIQNLENSKRSLELLKQMHEINRDLQKSLEETAKRQQEYYERISVLATASKTQKDNAFASYTSAKTQALGTKEKVLNLEKQILDMKYMIAQLEDSIDKKSIVLHEQYLYKLAVRKGDFVAPGSPLATVHDASRAKLILYLDPEELEGIEHKSVFLDDVKTVYKVDKIWKVADEKFISSYRAEIYLPAPKNSFSKLIKVEIK